MNIVRDHQSKPMAGPVRFFILLTIVVLATLLLSAFQQSNAVQVKTNEGERVFNQVCAACHQMDPPASMEDGRPIAPPMKMILRHYQMAFDSTEALKDALTSWLESPDVERAVLPAHAIEEHGLMPPLTITETERAAVVEYLLALLPDIDMEGMKKMEGEMDHDMEGMKGKMKGKMDHDMEGKMD